MTTTVSGSSITFNDNTTQNTSAYGGGFAFRNRIINGDMRIDQRNAGASISVTGGFFVDRWIEYFSGGGVYSAQQSSTAPAGFSNSSVLTVTTADSSIAAGDYYMIRHNIEGYNVADLGWGTANASTVTLSFWVRSSVTGTYGGSLTNSAETRSYPFTYSISAANTWEQKSITIAGDTSGTWLVTNGRGIGINFGLGMGSTYSGTAGSWASTVYLSATGATNWISTNGATFYITGVQLEKGSTATSFDYRSYSAELAMCQRYYWQQNYTQANNRFGMGTAAGTVTDGFQISLPVPMRTTPSFVLSNVGLYDGTSTFTISSIGANYSTPTLLSALINNSSSITAGKSVQLYAINSSASVSTSGAEL